jgi:hypothetical protein
VKREGGFEAGYNGMGKEAVHGLDGAFLLGPFEDHAIGVV